MLDPVRQLVDRRNKEQLPLLVVVATTQSDIGMLRAALTLPEDPINGVLYGGSPLPGTTVYAHGAFVDSARTNHGRTAAATILRMDADQLGSFSLSKDGLDQPAVLTAWWHLANDDFRVIQQLGPLVRQRGPLGEQATQLQERVIELLRQRKTELDQAPADFGTYMALERLKPGLDALRELAAEAREVNGRLREMSRNPSIRAEMEARQAYLNTRQRQVRASIDRQRIQECIDIFKAIQEQRPGTVYATRSQLAVGLLEQSLRPR